jgi:1-deoxy-D-xylulose-5-phosphate synthase
MQAKDEDEFVDMLWTMANHNEGPSAIRYPRGTGTGAKPKASPRILEIGKAEVVADGTDIALFGLGNLFEMAEKTRDRLVEMGYSVALINPRWIKPLDTACIDQFARQCGLILTFEDHTLMNGFGAAIIEHLNDAGIVCPVERIGWPDEFIEHGRPDILRAKHGLTVDHAVEKALKHLPARQKRALAG